MTSKLIAAAAALGALAGAAALTGPALAKPIRTETCFASTEWKAWAPVRGSDALYLRVGIRDIYRVELSRGTRPHRSPGEFLVNQVRGSNWICSPLDLDLAISDDMGFRRPLIATGLRKLSPAEIAAIPRKDLP